MPSSSLKIGRAIVLAGLLGLALSACGRRGPLEAPPLAKNAIDLPDEQTGAAENKPPDGTDISPVAIGKPPKANRAIKIPEGKFVLDPLL